MRGLKTFGVFVFGGVVGAGVSILWHYLGYVYYNIPGPSIGRLPYLLVQTPPEWLAYVVAGVFIIAILSFIAGRFLLARRAFDRATEGLPHKTRQAYRWWKGRAEELSGQLEQRTAECDSVARLTVEFHDKLAAVNQVMISRPVNEIEERKLLSFGGR